MIATPVLEADRDEVHDHYHALALRYTGLIDEAEAIAAHDGDHGPPDLLFRRYRVITELHAERYPECLVLVVPFSSAAADRAGSGLVAG